MPFWDALGAGESVAMRTSTEPTFRRVAFVAAEFDDPAGIGARYLHLGLVGLDRAQRLVQFDVIADGDVPGGYRGVLEALTEIGNQEVLHALAHGCCVAFSTQSSSRSTPGSHSFSSRAGG